MQIIGKKLKTEDVPSIITSAVERALNRMESCKAPGEDQIVVGMIRAGDVIALRKIQELSNAVLRTEAVSKECKMLSSH